MAKKVKKEKKVESNLDDGSLVSILSKRMDVISERVDLVHKRIDRLVAALSTAKPIKKDM